MECRTGCRGVERQGLGRMKTGIMTGTVFHKRFSPVEHEFRYKHGMLLVDIDELGAVCAQSRAVSLERFNWIAFFRQDYLPSSRSLRDEVTHQIKEKTGDAFEGQIYLLAMWRMLGVLMNPIAIFYCQNKEGALSHLVIEVHNTPWGERHVYVLRPPFTDPVDKAFHVSPFLPMALTYRFDAPEPNDVAALTIRVSNDEAQVFTSGFHFTRERFGPSEFRRFILNFPWITLSVMRRIYWQAFLLWIKRVPFFRHPGRASAPPMAR